VRPLLAIARKEAGDIARERTVVLAVLTQLLVAAFSAFISIGLVALADPGALGASAHGTVAYVGPGGFDDRLQQAGTLRVVRTGFDDALAGFRDGRYLAVVEETVDDPAPRRVALLLAEGDVRTPLLMAEMRTLLREYELSLRQERAERLEQEIVEVRTGARPGVVYGFAFAMLLPLLVATPVFIAGAITGDSFAHEIASRTLPLLRSTPAATRDILLGKLLPPVALAPAQVCLWIALFALNGLEVRNAPALVLYTTVLAALLSGVGIGIAFVVRRPSVSQSAYALAVLVLSAFALALPQDPLNVAARLAVGTADTVTWLTMAALGAAAVATLGLALVAAHRTLSRGAL